MNKKSYPQIYLEECKYKKKKIQTLRFINTELETDSESDSEREIQSQTQQQSINNKFKLSSIVIEAIRTVLFIYLFIL